MTPIKLITTDRSLPRWRSLPSKLSAIVRELNTIEGADFRIDVEYRDLTPAVRDGRITHEWMDNLSSQVGGEFVALHMSNAQRKKWGLKPSLRGLHQKDHDLVSEVYFWSDEHTQRGRHSQFIETFLHELRHALMTGMKLPDDTHIIHDTRGTLVGVGAFEKLDMDDYDPRARAIEHRLSLIDKLRGIIASMFEQPTTLLHPVPEPYNRYITQEYGVESTWYPRTGRHIGTDYGCPVGTKLVAPWQGRVTAAGKGAATGNFCHFEYTFGGVTYEERWNHLSVVPTLGEYKRGQVVALTGNTGHSTGPHLHREKWVGDVQIDLIDKTNWASLTVDPEK